MAGAMAAARRAVAAAVTVARATSAAHMHARVAASAAVASRAWAAAALGGAGVPRTLATRPATLDMEGSDDDFKPKMKTTPSDPAKLRAHIDEIVKSHPVVLFMKGTPEAPMCGFSQRVVQLLHHNGADIYGVDVLTNPAIRNFMKEYSSWPTFPQLFVGGEFVGGCDIAMQMQQAGELKELLDEKVPGRKATPSPAA